MNKIPTQDGFPEPEPIKATAINVLISLHETFAKQLLAVSSEFDGKETPLLTEHDKHILRGGRATPLKPDVF